MLSADDPVAFEALSGLLGAIGCSRGVLFELMPAERCFGPTAASGSLTVLGVQPRFSPDSLLPRWLRVNQQALSVPDEIGVFDTLPIVEQTALKNLAAKTAIPLMADDRLIAWASLSDSTSGLAVTGVLPPTVRAVADRLLEARAAAQERARVAGVARTNKLSLTGQMAAGIAHEVRNPLAAVRSIVQLVRKGAVPQSEQGRLLDNVVVEIDRVDGVVTSLLMLGRGTAPREETIELMALVADAVDFCRAYATQRRQTLEMILGSRLWVRGDAHELRQVLVNLLLNACQASQEGQAVVVHGKSETDAAGHLMATIEVVDQGVGMSAAVLAQVFEPFFSTKVNGGGLGLCLCRDVMRRYGGTIVVSSQLGVGTTVALTLPQ